MGTMYGTIFFFFWLPNSGHFVLTQNPKYHFLIFKIVINIGHQKTRISINSNSKNDHDLLLWRVTIPVRLITDLFTSFPEEQEAGPTGGIENKLEAGIGYLMTLVTNPHLN